MAKLVIEVQETNSHREGDVIVWSEKLGCYQVESKASYLANELAPIYKTIEVLNQKLDKQKEDISKLAKILKENLQK